MARQVEDAIINVVINGEKAISSFKELNKERRAQLALVQTLNKNTPEYGEQRRRLEDLNAAYVAWRRELNNDTAALDRFNAKLEDTGESALNNVANLERMNAEMLKSNNSSFWDKIKGLVGSTGMSVAAGNLIANGITAAIGSLKDLAKSVVETYARFEQMDTVLTNTLGDKGSSRRALNNLQTFAAETPFSLEELTSSYIKLVNRGIMPTMDEMRAMGDLASSQGKSFDQLTEAVLDAVTGEYERLKEFGIRAQKNGDMVSLSFKGITLDVKNSESAIKDALIQFGKMDGVAGGMEKISETVGGAISNMGDNWDRVLTSMGKSTGGFVHTTINYINDLLSYMADRFKSVEERLTDQADQYADAALKNYNKRSAAQKTAIIEGTKLEVAEMQKQLNELTKKANNATNSNTTDEDASQLMEKMDHLTRRIAEEKSFLESAAKQAETEQKADELKRQQAERERKIKEEADRKKAEKERDKRAKDLADYQSQLKDAKAEVDKFFADATKGANQNLDAQLKVIDDKYDKLIDKLKKLNSSKFSTNEDKQANSNAIVGLNAARDNEKENYRANDIYSSYEKAINDDAQAQLNEAKNNLSEQLINEDQFAKDEFDIEQKRLSDLFDLRTLFGQQTLDLETQLADGRVKNEKKAHDAHLKSIKDQQKSDENYLAIRKEIEAAKVQLSETGLELLTVAFGKSKGIMIAQLAIEKALAIGRIVAAEGVEIAGYYASNAAFGLVGVGIASTLAAAAKIRAGISIAEVIATGALQATNIASSKKYADGGILPDGPSHNNGGLKLVDPYGMVFGEIEGGEPVLSKKTYANNKSLVDALLNSQGKELNFSRVVKATTSMEWRKSVAAPTVQNDPAISNSTQSDKSIDLYKKFEELIAENRLTRQAIKDQRVILSTKLQENNTDKITKIRNDANA